MIELENSNKYSKRALTPFLLHGPYHASGYASGGQVIGNLVGQGISNANQ